MNQSTSRGAATQWGLPFFTSANKAFLPPSAEERKHFRDALSVELGMPVARRYSGGGDINGGCGMLAGKVAQD